jgi:hypothetical protein
MRVETGATEPSPFEEDLEAVAHDDEERRAVDITVNNRPVHLEQRRIDGAEIKTAAIAQGVEIQPDFCLFVKRGERWEQVGDDQEITVHDGEVFRAVAPDDNS